MNQRFLVVMLSACILVGCAQKRTVKEKRAASTKKQNKSKNAATSKTATTAPAQTKKTATAVPGDESPQPSKKDGPALRVALRGVAEITTVEKATRRIKDRAVISSVLGKLNLDQQLKGDRKPCPFKLSFAVNDAAGKNIGMIAVCAAKAGAWPGVFSSTQKGKIVEWAIAVPQGAALQAQIKSLLPGAISTSTGDVPAKGGPPKK